MKKIILVIVIDFIGMLANAAEPDIYRLIDKLREYSGVTTDSAGASLIEEYASSLAQAVAQNNPKLSKAEIQKLKKTITSRMNEKLAAGKKVDEAVYQLYLAHFSENEIKQLVSFYESDLIKKYQRIKPEIVEQSLAVSKQMMADIETEVAAELLVKASCRDNASGEEYINVVELQGKQRPGLSFDNIRHVLSYTGDKAVTVYRKEGFGKEKIATYTSGRMCSLQADNSFPCKPADSLQLNLEQYFNFTLENFERALYVKIEGFSLVKYNLKKHIKSNSETYQNRLANWQADNCARG